MFAKLSFTLLFFFGQLCLISAVQDFPSNSGEDFEHKKLTANNNNNSNISKFDVIQNSSYDNIVKVGQLFEREKRDLSVSLIEEINALKEDSKKIQNKIREIEEKLNVTHRWYMGRAANIKQNFLTESNKSKRSFEGKLGQLEDEIIEQISKNILITDGPCKLWPDGKIPFEIDSSLNNNITRSIKNLMNEFRNKTCILWIPRTSERAFVYFANDNNSQIQSTEKCYTGGQRIAILRDEFKSKEVLRRMAYILGLGSEHLSKYKDELTMSIYRANEKYNCKGCNLPDFQSPNEIGFNETQAVPVFENSHENRKYICRLSKDGHVLIGRGNVKTGECHYAYLWGVPYTTTDNVQFLTNPHQTKIQWVRRGEDFPTNAIPAGKDNNGLLLYIARCPEEPQWGESVVPGWLRSSEESMYMHKSYWRTNTCSSFDVLTL